MVFIVSEGIYFYLTQVSSYLLILINLIILWSAYLVELFIYGQTLGGITHFFSVLSKVSPGAQFNFSIVFFEVTSQRW